MAVKANSAFTGEQRHLFQHIKCPVAAGEPYTVIKTITSECMTKNILLTLQKHLQKPVTFLVYLNKYSPMFPLMAILFPEDKESDS